MSFQEEKRRLFIDDLKLYSCDVKGLDSLIQKILVFSADKGIYSYRNFSIKKCVLLSEISWYGVPDDKFIRSLQEGESYKYLGILNADSF